MNFLEISELLVGPAICEVFNSNIKTVVEKHAPFVTYKTKVNIAPFVTDDFFKAITD